MCLPYGAKAQRQHDRQKRVLEGFRCHNMSATPRNMLVFGGMTTVPVAPTSLSLPWQSISVDPIVEARRKARTKFGPFMWFRIYRFRLDLVIRNNSIPMKKLLFLASLSLAGCAHNVAPQEPIDIGDPPSFSAADSAIKSYLRENLKDPDSIKDFEIMSGGYQRVTWFKGGLLTGGKDVSGWLFCARYNAKNSYGAYVGRKTDSFVLNNKYGLEVISANENDRRCRR